MSRAGRTFPTGACAGLVTQPSRSRAWSSTFIVCRVTNAPRGGSEFDKPGPPHPVVFETKPIAFALHDVLPGTDLASVAQPGIGAAIWLHATDVPDGYQVTLHDRA